MTLQIVAYSLVVGAALALVGHCCERIAAWRAVPRRLVWVVILATSIGYPLAAVLVAKPAAAPAAMRADLAGALPSVRPSGTQPALAPDMTPAAPAAPDAQESFRVAPATISGTATWQPQWSLPGVSDSSLAATWIVLSAFIYLYLLAASFLLHRRVARWRPATVCGQPVLVSATTGPALVGIWRPRIVVPQWFLDEPPDRQALILAHERMHQWSHDPLLLRVALLVVAAVPWNLPLWWQLRRLRRAIELDCDARVMRTGARAVAYGEVLLHVAQRAGATPVGAVAMSQPASTLEYRIRHLTPVPVRRAVLRASGAAMLAMGGAAVAVTLDAPALPGRVATILQTSTPPASPFSALLVAAAEQVPVAAALPQPADLSAGDPSSVRQHDDADASLPETSGTLSAASSLPAAAGPVAASLDAADAAGRALQVLLQTYPELLDGPNRDGWYSAAVALRADGSLFRSGLRFSNERAQAIRDILDLRYIPEAAAQRAGIPVRRSAGRPDLVLKAPGDVVDEGRALQNYLVFHYTVLPPDYDEQRSLLAVWEAVFARHAELLLPRDAPVANRVTIFLTEDGRIAREKVEVGPRAQMLEGPPDFTALGIGAQDIGVRGTVTLIRNDYTEVDAAPDDQQLLRAALWSALGVRDELRVHYAWPRRADEPAGGVGATPVRPVAGTVGLRIAAAEVLQSVP